MDDQGASDAWDDAISGSEGLVAGAGPSLSRRLDTWLADARVDGSADARAREHWLRAAADADATFGGVLLDLAERGVTVAVTSVAGRRLQGVIEVLGADFAALRLASGVEVLAALSAVASVRTAPAIGTADGERVVTTDLRLADVLSELASDRSRVRIVTDAGEVVAGELRSVGQDVVTVRGDGEIAGIAYLRTAAVAEVVVG